MIGRSAEWAVVTDLLSAASGGGAALVVEGDAGMGKSTLLAAAADWAAAHGFRRVDCCGLQSHAGMGFAAIHQLVHPLLDDAARTLPARQRHALLTAFGLDDGPPPDRLLVSLAVLGLLEEAASQRRLLLVVDDAQWMDQSSLDVLAFVARRLGNAPLVMLAAQRSPVGDSARGLDGLPTLSLGPLPREEAQRLLDCSQPPSDEPTTARTRLQDVVLDQAGGNPLAIIELSAALADDAAGSAIFTGEPLPTSQRVERAFLAQLDTLTEPSRTLLLLIAASDGSLGEICSAAGVLDVDFARALAPLERAGLVRVGGGSLQVRHPLIRSTVYRAATLSSRCLVHDALARVTGDPMRAAWHRAEATVGSDETVAAVLQAAAEEACSRGAGAEAAAAMRRAAALSPESDARIRRLTTAAEWARSAGLIADARNTLREVDSVAGDTPARARTALVRFVLDNATGVPGRSAEDYLALAGECADGDVLHRQMLWAAAVSCRLHGLPEDSRRRVHAALGSIDVPLDPWTEIATALVDDTGYGPIFRRRLPRLVEALADAPLLLTSLASAAEATTERSAALACWEQVQRRARHRSSPADECEGLRGAAQLHLADGRIDAALVAGQSALRMAEDMKLTMTAGSAAASVARALSWRGDAEEAAAALASARALLACAPTILWHDDVRWAAGWAALCVNDFAEAHRHLSAMGAHRTSRRWAIADLAEAAVGSGHGEAVRSRVADVAEEARLLGFDSMLVHRAQALLADADDDAEAHYEAALNAASNAVLETARTHLLFGEWLRRRRRITDARAHLSTAVSAFHAAGAVPLRHRAAAELRAAGVTTAACPPAHRAAALLTAQELQIARMAADGMSNREIADRIYVSHRTVAAHLYKVFPKLGITSRNQLHGALGDTPPTRAVI